MNTKSLFYVVLAIVLAVAAGAITGSNASVGGITFLQLYTLFGRVFLNALSLVVVPLVAASIITGTARMASDGSFRDLGKKTLLYFVGTTTLAVLVGYTLGIVIQPGVGSVPMQVDAPVTYGQEQAFDAVANIFLQIIPQNIFAVASEGQILGLIVFSIVFGLMIPTIETKAGEAVLNFWDGILQIMMKITRLVMRFLPFGVFALVAKVVAETGMVSLQRAGIFFAVTLLGLALYTLVVLPLLLRLLGGVNPWHHLRAMSPAMLTAFVTSSSAATIPVSMECLESRARVSKRISSFIVPLGCSLNMSGSSIYIVLAVLTVAQAYGIALSLASSCLLILMSVLVSTGMAGIPSASLVAIMMILETMHLPAEGIGLVLVVDRILDMCRTSVTVFGNSCCAVLVEGAPATNPQPAQ